MFEILFRNKLSAKNKIHIYFEPRVVLIPANTRPVHLYYDLYRFILIPFLFDSIIAYFQRSRLNIPFFRNLLHSLQSQAIPFVVGPPSGFRYSEPCASTTLISCDPLLSFLCLFLRRKSRKFFF
jgi:hypothetical protein